jgi:hypothetical protein
MLHPALALAWLLAALAALASPAAGWPPRLGAVAGGLLLALLPPQLRAGGWWPSMADSAFLGLIATGAGWALLATLRHPVTKLLAGLVGFGLAGFHLAFGIVALDNGGPLPGFVALKAASAGVAVLATLALGTRAHRPAALLLVAALAAATLLAITQWAPAVPAAGYLHLG